MQIKLTRATLYHQISEALTLPRNRSCDGTTHPASNRRTELRPLPHHRIDKAIACIGMTLSARLQDMAEQKQAGESKTVLKILVRPDIGSRLASIISLAQERRQS